MNLEEYKHKRQLYEKLVLTFDPLQSITLAIGCTISTNERFLRHGLRLFSEHQYRKG